MNPSLYVVCYRYKRPASNTEGWMPCSDLLYRIQDAMKYAEERQSDQYEYGVFAVPLTPVC